MNIIYADFNALTEDRSIVLTTRGSQEDIRKHGVGPGDWVWLSDGELQVGARIDEDPRHQLVGVPSWETMVDIAEVKPDDAIEILGEIRELLDRPHRTSPDVLKRVMELTIRSERAKPPENSDVRPGIFAFRRAMCLYWYGNYEFALAEVEEALASEPEKFDYIFLFLNLLLRLDPARSVLEAEKYAFSEDADASVLGAAINILGSEAERLPEDQFAPVARATLELCDRFEHAPGRSQISASLLSLVHFNRGLVLLRLGRNDEARRALELAHAIDPIDLTLDEATQLVAFDDRAREIASRVRAKPIAA